MNNIKRYLFYVILANCLFVYGIITKDFYLLIPLNLGILWGYLRKDKEV